MRPWRSLNSALPDDFPYLLFWWWWWRALCKTQNLPQVFSWIEMWCLWRPVSVIHIIFILIHWHFVHGGKRLLSAMFAVRKCFLTGKRGLKAEKEWEIKRKWENKYETVVYIFSSSSLVLFFFMHWALTASILQKEQKHVRGVTVFPGQIASWWKW